MSNGLVGFAMTKDTQDMFIDEAGNLGIVGGIDCMADNLKTNCKLWIKEYDYDTIIGVPYQTIIGNPHVNSTTLNTHFTNALLLSNKYLTQAQQSAFGINSTQSLVFSEDNTTRELLMNATVLLNNNTAIQVEI
jgi:hypothetical protein